MPTLEEMSARVSLGANTAIRDLFDLALTDGRFDQPRQMLSRYCIICGKALTDPASMSRFIGPECFGSGSIDIPWLHAATIPEAGICRWRRESAAIRRNLIWWCA